LGISEDEPPCHLYAGGPALPPYLREKKTLAYKVLIHIRSVADFNPRSPSSRPGGSPASDADSSGLDDPDDGFHSSRGSGPRIHAFACDRGIPDGDADYGSRRHGGRGSAHGPACHQAGTARACAGTGPAGLACRGPPTWAAPAARHRDANAIAGLRPTAAARQTKKPARQVWRPIRPETKPQQQHTIEPVVVWLPAQAGETARRCENLAELAPATGSEQRDDPTQALDNAADSPTVDTQRLDHSANSSTTGGGDRDRCKGTHDINADWAAALEGPLRTTSVVAYSQSQEAPARGSPAQAAPAVDGG